MWQAWCVMQSGKVWFPWNLRTYLINAVDGGAIRFYPCSWEFTESIARVRCLEPAIPAHRTSLDPSRFAHFACHWPWGMHPTPG